MDNTAQSSNPPSSTTSQQDTQESVASQPQAADTSTTPPPAPEPPTAPAPSPAPMTPPASETPVPPAPVTPADPPTPAPEPPVSAPATPAPEPPTVPAPSPAPMTPPASETPAPPAPVTPTPSDIYATDKPSDSKDASSLAGSQTPPPPIQPKTKRWHISPWTLILILVLAGFAGFFLYIAFSPKAIAPTTKQVLAPTPTPAAQSVLSLQPAAVGTGEANLKTTTYDVVIDTNVNTVNAVQLELSYDPAVLTNVSVTPGTFFSDPLQLVKDIDTQNGRISYALGIQPKDKGIKGTGVVAQVSFQFQPTATVSSTMMSFLPKTLVAAQGVNPSVLKSTTDATIMVPGKAGAKTTTAPLTTPMPSTAQ